MRTYTDADLESDLRAALDTGNTTTIATLSREVDRRDTHQPPVELHAAALWYAEQGLRVFPLSPRTKIPFKGSKGCRGASNDVDQVNAWWAEHPDANIGLATGHLVDVVDIDGHLGQTSRAQHWPMFDRLHVLGRVLTPRAGGMHLFVPAMPGISNGAGLLPGIDYRGDGGYVVAPPSVNDQGTYRWLSPLDVAATAVVAA